jgi:hypothetical protein
VRDLLEKLIEEIIIGPFPPLPEPGPQPRHGVCGGGFFLQGDIVKVQDFLIAYRDLAKWVNNMMILLENVDPNLELPHKSL